ncbi:outer membrane protein assembly factor BamB family protein [Rhodopirellula halodulae]|uniref:outer membrane protein assembly factor BamB family protein n=1 Tax=Rhodopirellula halodulae TaxID=2894198 RepID=UPI001E36D78D|nr:PQQ-binding-like beta-propeller repeat protein [Rhodopirellula sp. JC737]MCC9656120.1 PQQ-like beta-propeller repeat protein [Rhodopirellula sp. JC737]
MPTTVNMRLKSVQRVSERFGLPSLCRGFAVCAGLTLAAPATLLAEESSPRNVADSWSRFHGEASHGDAGAGTLPSEWTEADYAWTADLNARHVGSPVVADGKVFLLSTSAEQDTESMSLNLLSLDAKTGELLWKRSHPFVERHRHSRNTAASSTPAVHEGRVHFAYADANHAELLTYDLNGELIWSRNLGPWSGVHGFGASPVVIDSKLLLFNDQQSKSLEAWQTPGKSFMLAFDPSTGATIWESPLTSTRPSYGVPTTDGRYLIGASTGNGIFGLDPDTGKLKWSLNVFNKRCCSCPLVIGDLAFGTCGSGGGGNYLSAVRIPQDDSQKPVEVFRIDKAAPYVPTPAVKGPWMFLISDNGIASCVRWEDGSNVWSKRLGGNFGASPIIVGDQLLAISLDGTAYVMSASDQPGSISKFDLGGPVGATPAYADGRLFLRINDQLCCLNTK